MQNPSQPIALHTYLAGSGAPLLCLHGHPGSGQSMSVFTDRLSQNFQTLAPDLRGYGHSRVAADFAMTDHLLDLEALLNKHQVDRTLVLGWSLGGILAIELALKFPERVSGLILVATAARPWGNHPPVSLLDNLFTGVASIVNKLHPAWQWNINTFGKRSLYRHLIQQHTLTAYRYLAKDAFPAYLQTSPYANRALQASLRKRYNRLYDLPKIHCPCLVLAGENDVHITSAASHETARSLPNAEWHCYPNTAHLFPWEIPDRVLADIAAWIAQQNLSK